MEDGSSSSPGGQVLNGSSSQGHRSRAVSSQTFADGSGRNWKAAAAYPGSDVTHTETCTIRTQVLLSEEL